MAAEPGVSYYRNLDNNDYSYGGSSDKKVLSVTELASLFPKIDWSKSGYHFKNWNTKRDGSGQNYYPHDIIGSVKSSTLYAIWEKDSMSYVDKNTPVIEKITLPSGNTYYIADREIRDVVDAMGDAIAGGVSFIVGWDGTSAPEVGNIPEGVTVTYNGTTYTGTLDADNAQPGAFYLVKSATITTGVPSDSYDEYVPVGSTGSKTWEKIGDTQIDLSDVVTGVSLTKQTDTVVGTDATFKITQPTIALATDATSGTGKVQVVTDISSASASGDSVTAVTGLGTPSKDTFLKGVKVTTQPTVSLTANTATATGRITYVQAQGTATTTKVSGATVDNDDDSVTAITSLGTPTTQSAVKSVTPTTKKLATSSITGVQASTTTASKATAGTAQTTATGAGTSSTTNTDWLKGVSVSNGVLTIGAATMNTQSTPQYSFSDVTVPIKAASATTVATGATTTSGTGADVVTDVSVGDTFSAVTGYTPTTDSVLGSDTTFTTTLASGTTGDITVATGIGAATTRYLSASASGTAVGADGTGDAVTALGTPTTDTVLGTGSTITVTPTKTYVKGTASGANTQWNNKDSVTVLKDTTDVSVTKG